MKIITRKRSPALADLPGPLLSLIGSKCSYCSKKNLRATCKALHGVLCPTALELRSFAELAEEDTSCVSELASLRPGVTSARIHTPHLDAGTWLDAATSSLMHWHQLQEVEVPAYSPLIEVLVNSCGSMRRLTLLSHSTPDKAQQEAQLTASLRQLAGMPSLRELLVLGQYVSTCEAVQHVGALVQLQLLQLSIAGMQVSTLLDLGDICQGLAALTNLTSLNLTCVVVQHKGDCSLSSLTALRSLSLQLPHLLSNTLPHPFTSFSPHLTQLEVGLPHSLAPAALQPLSQLVRLSAAGSTLDPNLLSALADCPHLASLTVGNVYLNTLDIAASLDSLTHLTVQHVFYCTASLQVVAPKLQQLVLEHATGPCDLMGLLNHTSLSCLWLPYHAMAAAAASILSLCSIASLSTLVLHGLDSPSPSAPPPMPARQPHLHPRHTSTHMAQAAKGQPSQAHAPPYLSSQSLQHQQAWTRAGSAAQQYAVPQQYAAAQQYAVSQQYAAAQHYSPGLPTLPQLRNLTLMSRAGFVSAQRLHSLQAATPFLKTLQLYCGDPAAARLPQRRGGGAAAAGHDTSDDEDDREEAEHALSQELARLAAAIAGMRCLQHVKLSVAVLVPFEEDGPGRRWAAAAAGRRAAAAAAAVPRPPELTNMLRRLAINPLLARISLTHVAEVPELYMPGTAKHAWLAEVKRQVEEARLPDDRFLITYFD